MSHAVNFAVNAALVKRQRQHCVWIVSLAPTHKSRAQVWTGHTYRFSSSVWPDRETNPDYYQIGE